MEIPRIGMGTGQLKPDIAQELVTRAFENGYRHIDLAYSYGNEKQIGLAFKEYFKINNRQDYWITTKLAIWNHSSENVYKQVDEQLGYLGLEYIDLLLIHWPISVQQDNYKKLTHIPLRETWRAMEKLVQQKKVRNIGVCNFTVQLLVDMMSYSEIQPFCNQIETHLFHQNTQLIQFCLSNKIKVVAYSPLGGQNKQFNNIQEVQDNKVLKQIALKYDKTVIQIILKWHLQRFKDDNYIIIQKSSYLDRLVSNLIDYDQLNLDEEEINSLNMLDRRQISCNPFIYFDIPLFN